jgi:hypothetical protein
MTTTRPQGGIKASGVSGTGNRNPFFGVYENALSPEFCRAAIQRFDKDPQVGPGRYGNGTVGGAVDANIKQTTEIDLDGTQQGWRVEEQILMESLGAHLRRYMERWSRAFNCDLIHEPLKIARYPIGGQFDWHSDNLGNGVTTRVITALWYLNTVEQGGETEYPWQKMAIKPVEGRLLLCPVGWTFVHRGAPPVSGPKYIAITQLHQRSTEMPGN